MTLSPTQTFYQQIAHNRRESLLLILVVALLFAALGFSIGYATTGTSSGAIAALVIAMILAGLLSAGSYFAGDSLVLASSSAKEITEQQAPQLFDVVRELSIAADIPMPRVFIVDDASPNAFATGRDPQHASVAITTGLLQKLDREELQGVIGHEMSHVRNLDIRFMLLVGVLVGGIALLADFFLRFSFFTGLSGGGRRRDNDSSGGLQAIFFVVAIVLSIIAPIAAALVQLAVSRQREYLADASSVELTRNPYGLERALAKIAADTEPLKEANRATQHLYIVNPLKKLDDHSSSLFSTHPPILDRINRLRQLSGEGPLDPGSSQGLAQLD